MISGPRQAWFNFIKSKSSIKLSISFQVILCNSTLMTIPYSSLFLCFREAGFMYVPGPGSNDQNGCERKKNEKKLDIVYIKVRLVIGALWSCITKMSHDYVSVLLANGSLAFIWKLGCHWLKGLQLHLNILVKQGPCLNGILSILSLSIMSLTVTVSILF